MPDNMWIDPVAGHLGTRGDVNAGGNVFGNVIQARGPYMQSLGEIHVNHYVQLNEAARVAGNHSIQYRWDWWIGFYADWDWGGPGNLYLRVNAGTDAWIGAASDERLKQDIAPSTFDCLASVLSWPLYQFQWKDIDQLNERLEVVERSVTSQHALIGFVAQRQAEVFPAMVAKGRPEDGLWSINTNVALAALTGAVQQLADRLDALEQRTR